MNQEEFEKIIEKSVSSLPEKIQKMMENVAICIDDEIPDIRKKRGGIRVSGNLLGLYQGIPKTTWGRSAVSGRLPDKITIFKKNIEKSAKTKEKIEELIKIVVWHEIAHHFGFEEEGVRKLESKWEK
jgi:predicted Zn-dependent protease with MMP-like domain